MCLDSRAMDPNLEILYLIDCNLMDRMEPGSMGRLFGLALLNQCHCYGSCCEELFEIFLKILYSDSLINPIE